MVERAARAPSLLHHAFSRLHVGWRMAAYAAAFLPSLLVLLPWLAHQAALAWLPCAFDLGRWRWLGWALFTVGLAGYAGASLWLVRCGRGAYVEFDPPRVLVTTGPYAWCRNPVAASAAVMLAGLTVAFSSAGLLVLSLLVAMLAHVQAVRIEEPRLAQRFGAAYEAYRHRVPRWMPRPPGSRRVAR